MGSRKLFLVQMVESGKLYLTDPLTAGESITELEGSPCRVLGSFDEPADAEEVFRAMRPYLLPGAPVNGITGTADGRAQGRRKSKSGTKQTGRRPVQDHMGNTFPDIRTMCEAYHISAQTYYGRLRRGMSREQALSIPGRVQNSGSCTDHLGNVYKDIKAMCIAYGISQNQFYIRRRAGQTLEQILLGNAPGKWAVTVDGVMYPSKRELCRRMEVSYQRFLVLQSEGLNPEQAVHRLLDNKRHREERQRAIASGAIVPRRRKPYQGGRKKKATGRRSANKTTPGGSRSVQDHKGNVYPSQKAMCDAYGIQYQTYRQRIRSGYDLEAALCMQTARPGRAQVARKTQPEPEAPGTVVRRIPKEQIASEKTPETTEPAV